MSSPDCPSDDRLQAFDHGAVSDLELEAIAEHLATCPVCMGRLSGLARPAAVAAALLTPAPEEPPEDSAYWRAIERVTGKPAPGNRWLGPGDRLGEYSLVEKLGEGGMGTVFRAVHSRLGREVALKVLRRGRAADAAAAARFEREMRAVGRLRHPNIVHATDAGESDGVLYLVMELVEGQNLSELVKDRGPLPPAEAFDLIRQAADALQHAHEAGFVHRDVKPSNLIRSADGRVKLLDLGLATWPVSVPGTAPPSADTVAAAATSTGLTSASLVVGTYEYMAPEQKRDPRAVDARADVYGLGCTLWFLLTGKPPRPEALLGSGQRPVGLPAELWRRFLASDPAHRFPSATAAAAALANPAPPRSSTRRWLIAAGAVAAAAAGVVIAVNRWSKPTPDGSGDTGSVTVATGAPDPQPQLRRGKLPMTADEARELQKDCADFLGVPLMTDGPIGMRFALIPPGEVSLGQKTVRIDAPYRIGTTEVTRGQFAAFVAAKGYKTDAETSGKGGAKVTKMTVPFKATPSPENRWDRLNFGTPIDDDLNAPAIHVSARDAAAFCAWLSEREPGVVYRLPTVAEWAWAVRAGVGGMRPSETVAEVRKHAPVSATAPHPVGQFLPNAWGLYDGLGNVAEWAADVPTATPTRRHICGGFYFEVPAFDTAGTSPETFAASFIGFRVVREVKPPAPLPAVGKLPMTPAEAKALQKSWTEHLGRPTTARNAHGLTFALVPPGEFDLAPGCRVRITAPYYLGTCEVTHGQFRRFTLAKPYTTTPEASGKGGFRLRLDAGPQHQVVPNPKTVWNYPGHRVVSDDHPVTVVSWEDAVEFCKWLGERDGGVYRLPSEAELAWAARCGSASNSHLPRKSEEALALGWHRENAGQPMPVGRKAANAWGLHDLFGNVAEWCRDFDVQPLPPGTHDDWAGPTESTTGLRVVFGQTYLAPGLSYQFYKFREAFAPADGWAHVGFRVICDVPPGTPSAGHLNSP